MVKCFVLLIMFLVLPAMAAKTPVLQREGSVEEILKLPSAHRQLSLRRLGESSFLPLKNTIRNEGVQMSLRWRALTSLAKIYGKRAMPEILWASSHLLWYMRNASLLALSHLNSERAVKLAKKLIEDPAMVVRAAAVDVFRKWGASEHRDLLWRSLYDSKNFHKGRSLWIRRRTAQVFADLAQRGDEKRLVQLLGDRDSSLHFFAVSGLERLTGRKLGSDKDSVQIKGKRWASWWQQHRLN